MRLKDYDDRDGKKVWLSENELQLLLDQIQDHAPKKVALLLAGRCGLRRNEITDITPTDLVDTDHGRVVRIWEGKADKYREVPCPDQLYYMVDGMTTTPDEPIVDVDDSTIYDWVNNTAQSLRLETGDEGWQYVGPHDLRRSWGVRLLEAAVNPAVVMEWGGWEDYRTFREHYLTEFSPEALRRERGKVGWLGGEEDDEVSYAAVSAAAHPSSGRQPPG